MILHNAYQAVIGGLQQYRPSIEFPVPQGLVEYYLYTFAAQALFERQKQTRGNFVAEGWMVQRFDCLTPVALAAPSCVGDCYTSEYYIDLATVAATPMALRDDAGIRNIWITESGAKVTHVPYSVLGVASGLRQYAPSDENPSATWVDGKLYLFGGDRDFSQVHIRIDIIPGSTPLITAAGECLNKTAVLPVPQDLEAAVIQTTTTWLHGTLSSGKLDIILNGRFDGQKVSNK